MTNAKPHFEVDRAGLAKLLERRGKSFAVLELIQNAWDENITEVRVSVTPVPQRALVRLVVEDDAPSGWADLTHAYTLFAESAKKSDPTKRGRWNLGEKLVLAICTEASIETTTGTVTFDKSGRHHYPRRKRDRGSKFEGLLRLTRDELAEVESAVSSLIPPQGIHTTFNGEQLRARAPIASFEAALPTERADDDEGHLRPTRRRTTVCIYEPVDGRPAALYELGIPVVETGDRWDVEVWQKVPLNTDRDNVTPAYLRDVRARVLNHMHGALDAESATEGWVGQSLEDPDVSPEAVDSVLTARYGEKRVIADPSDPEGTKIAHSRGFSIIQPGSFNRRQWESIRRSCAALPAGRVTPSLRPYSSDPDAPVRTELPRSKWTPGIERIVAFTERIAERLSGVRPQVLIIDDWHVRASATYGRGPGGGQFEFNVARLGRQWFEQEPASERVLDIILHELGHHYEADHLSARYHRALTRLSARLARLALAEPNLFA